jgi:formylglycine-generating enzyme required for sulfatase activity
MRTTTFSITFCIALAGIGIAGEPAEEHKKDVAGDKAAAENARHGQGEGSSPSPQSGERYALLVGVREYDKASGLRPLAFSENDVTRLADVLKASGYRPENVVVMTDSRESTPARLLPEREKILYQLDSLLRDRSDGDTVLIAFAGHGVHFRGNEDSYFCPLDARLDKNGSLVSIAQVYRRLEGCRADLKLLVYDACRNDPFPPMTRGLEPLLEDKSRAPRMAPPGGVAAFYSCSEGEVAYEDTDLRQGVFFHFVVRGLQGDADLDKDRKVTLPELEYYTKRRVMDYVRVQFGGNRQMPNLRGNTRGLVALADVTAAAKQLQLAELKKPGSGRSPLDTPPEQNMPIKVAHTNSLGMPFILVPAGQFLMGNSTVMETSNESSPQHRVRISRPFFLGAFEVTQREYAEVMGSNPSYFANGAPGESELLDFIRTRRQNLKSARTDWHPAEQVTWKDAVEFCRRLSKREGKTYRLPTEAEWEYACRAGTQTRCSWGDSILDCEEFSFWGWTTGPVGHLIPNVWGVFDMHGNVWEWCSDRYDPNYYRASPSVDPQGPEGDAVLRVVRGGGFDHAAAVPASKRHYAPEHRAAKNIGFRVVLELAGDEVVALGASSGMVGVAHTDKEVPLPPFSRMVRAADTDKNAREKLRLAAEAMTSGNAVEAKRLLEESLVLEPGLAFEYVEWPETSLFGQRRVAKKQACLARASLYGFGSAEAKAIVLYGQAGDLARTGRYQEAIALYLRGIESDPKFVWNANNLAWLLATCSQESVRDGEAAAKYGRQACANSGWTYWSLLSTLAAAYAQAGDFATAIRLQELSRQNYRGVPSGSTAPDFDVADWEYNLGRYRQGKSWADVPRRTTPPTNPRGGD